MKNLLVDIVINSWFIIPLLAIISWELILELLFKQH